MKAYIQDIIFSAISSEEISKNMVEINIPDDAKNGDFSSNIAMKLTKVLKKNPREIAEHVIEGIKKTENKNIEKIEIAGPGFINITLSKGFYAEKINELFDQHENIGKTERLKNKIYIAEHTDPNLFKEVHIGHVMTNVIGESFYRLAQFAGADVKNVTFQGDVGLHIAKALWGIKNLGEKLPHEKTPYEKQKFLGKCYVFGEKHFSAETDNEATHDAKTEILAINKKIYSREDPLQNELYDLGCSWSLEYLETMYALLGSKFDHYFLESTTFTDGQRIVEENTGDNGKKVFEKSGKATIFPGSKYNLHDRVFINSEGLPTYEAKDIGLFYKKWEKYNPDYSLTITGGDQKEYFEIVREAAGMINPEWKEKTMHRAHGILKLKTGKMSSRTGGIIRGQDWIEEATENVAKNVDDTFANKKEISKNIAISAIKYSILKVSAGKDIVYDESVALDFTGNTGPYLLYAYVRAQSILEKIDKNILSDKIYEKSSEISPLEKQFLQFETVLETSLSSLSSHHLANYLYALASEFSSFYAHTKVLDESNPDYIYNLKMISIFKNIMKNGLYCMGITTVEKM